ncbi:SDR family oxidoreductase [Desulfatirhabdium butyrativorans]|uniref:SDR family oxidoreductase n=1 Tax=Desulfatirhabdium butyrativorans TaxID=340467 RepID=UPI00040CDF3C|nr:SDR family oxidoreductase [Desulfatirhabdium butyrativorans]
MIEKPILVCGATGYVGGRLIPLLLQKGYRVRAAARSVDKVRARPWGRHPMLEVVSADVLDLGSLAKAASGCSATYYLVHSMNAQGKRFADADRISAKNMAAAASAAGHERIIYLSGLGEPNNPHLSPHLRSRHEVGDILRAGDVPCTVLKAAMILGAGSASFEILRYLVERLPVMITPSWVSTPCQPIAIGNVLHYLAECLEKPETSGRVFDIGGPDILTYRDIIHIYAAEAGLPKRWIIPVPLVTPKLSAYWIHLVTPIPSSIAIPLTEGLSVPVICRENAIRDIIPQRLIDCRESIRTAIQDILSHQVDSCWFDAGLERPPEWVHCGDADYAGGTLLECRVSTIIEATAPDIWPFIERIGGETGWYFGNVLWKLRGLLDRLLGGIGMRIGRKDPQMLSVGDPLDFWRVIQLQAPNRLVLQAEMKMPGEAVLDIRIAPVDDRRIQLSLFSRFLPRGLWGNIYWYLLYPVHAWIFLGMLRAIAEATGRPIVEAPKLNMP